MLDTPTLRGNGFILRPYNLILDKADFIRNINDPEVIGQLPLIAHPYDEESFRIWEKHIDNLEKGIDKFISFCIDVNGECVGDISLQSVPNKPTRAHLGYWLAKKHWGKGIMTEAVDLVCNYGADKFGLDTVISDIAEPNIASRRVLEKNGFKMIGKVKGGYEIEGIKCDKILFEKPLK